MPISLSNPTAASPRPNNTAGGRVPPLKLVNYAWPSIQTLATLHINSGGPIYCGLGSQVAYRRAYVRVGHDARLPTSRSGSPK